MNPKGETDYGEFIFDVFTTTTPSETRSPSIGAKGFGATLGPTASLYSDTAYWPIRGYALIRVIYNTANTRI